jgi:hypothetical protein
VDREAYARFAGARVAERDDLCDVVPWLCRLCHEEQDLRLYVSYERLDQDDEVSLCRQPVLRETIDAASLIARFIQGPKESRQAALFKIFQTNAAFVSTTKMGGSWKLPERDSA